MERKLYRIPKDGTIAGVCAGLAEYFKADVTLVRILAVIAVFATDGAFVVVYFVLALVIPVKDREQREETTGEKVRSLAQEVSSKGVTNSVHYWAGMVLIVIGLLYTLRLVFPDIFALRWDVVWAILLVCIGVAIVMKGKDNNV